MNTIATERLLLRPFTESDAPPVVALAGDRRIADTMISIPHPYTIEHYNQWLAAIYSAKERDRSYHFAITEKNDNKLVGSVEIRDIDSEHRQAELSLWIGTGYWNRGYASEAANAVIEFAFNRLGLNRIYAHHMMRNPACESLFKKIGMQREGILRQRVIKWNVPEDVGLYAILKDDIKGR